MNRRGQINTIDLFVAVTVFIILIVALVLVWSDFTRKLDSKVKYDDLNEKAIKITDIMVETRGVPNDWEQDSDNVAIIGLVSNDRVLLDNKVDEFLDMDYDEVKEIFNIEAYDFYFRIIDSNNGIIQVNGEDAEAGIKPELNTEDIVTIKRIITRGGTKVVLEFTLWQ